MNTNFCSTSSGVLAHRGSITYRSPTTASEQSIIFKFLADYFHILFYSVFYLKLRIVFLSIFCCFFLLHRVSNIFFLNYCITSKESWPNFVGYCLIWLCQHDIHVTDGPENTITCSIYLGDLQKEYN